MGFLQKEEVKRRRSTGGEGVSSSPVTVPPTIPRAAGGLEVPSSPNKSSN
mgnify:CR=1 FL=1